MIDLAQTTILAAEESGDGGLELLLPATPELIAGVIAFALVFFFIRLWAMPAINDSLENRRKAITGQMEEAEKAKAEAEKLRADYAAQLAEAQAEKNQIIEAARAEADGVKTELIAKAEAQAAEILDKARADAAAEKARVMQDAQREVANLTVDLAEKVVGSNLDRQTQLGLVERYIAELER
ncbi:MAG TPA: F0F1 ATP synthase subunit B [Acidimicrobiia bacterium]|nr:F0F1 ATP synthase subunit B [Acidimicrobiia bacterium]